MKLPIYLIACGLIPSFIACQNTNRNDQATGGTEDSVAATVPTDAEQKFCFLHTAGTQQQDSSYIQLNIRKETVSGVYNTIPFEKDARRGTVMGTANDNILDLVWTFNQEGMQDTMRVVFTLRDGKLLQKPLTVDTASGRQMTRDSSNFSIVYEPTDCVAD